jgi:L-malate glycosyltransferase
VRKACGLPGRVYDKVKVVYVIDDFWPIGGTAHAVNALLSAATCRFVFFLYRNEEINTRFRTTILRNNTAVLVPGNQRKFLAEWRSLCKVVQVEHPDAIIANFFRAEALVAALPHAVTAGAARVIWYHGCVKPKDSARRVLPYALLRRFDAAIYNSAFTRNSLERRYGALRRITGEVIYNGVVERASTESPDTTRRTLRLATIGGFLALRNHLTVVRAVGILRDRLASSGMDIEWHLVGSGGECEGALAQSVVDLGLQANVVFHGQLENPWNVIPGDCIYVNPALEEAFGVATVEAMLRSMPVVAAAAGSLPEIINDGVTGCLVSAPRDPRAWSNVVFDLWSDVDMCDRVRTLARRAAMERFSPETFAAKFESFIARHGHNTGGLRISAK